MPSKKHVKAILHQQSICYLSLNLPQQSEKSFWKPELFTIQQKIRQLLFI